MENYTFCMFNFGLIPQIHIFSLIQDNDGKGMYYM